MEIRTAEWKDRILFFLGRYRALLVDGDSMLPTLKNGDTVLVDPCASGNIGEIVAANHPYRQNIKVIKRVESISPEGRYTLVGDNSSESTDSRTFGTVSKNDIAGRVVCKIKN
jgi:nickel-type superoxide dismutase maturation protease